MVWCSRGCFIFVIITLTNVLLTRSFLTVQKQSFRRVIASNNKISMGTDRTFHNLEKLTKKLFLPILMSVFLTAVPVISNAYWDENNEWVELKESGFQEVWGDR